MPLSRRDFEKLKRLRQTFDRNYRVTQLYSTYLERFPELITREAVDTLTADGAIDETSAIGALLSVAFGLDTEQNAEDRVLARDYIWPSVRILDPARYYNDPYYRTVRIPDTAIGRISFKNECYPAYRGVICDDIYADANGKEVPPLGFFREPFYFPAVLEDGNEWMTLAPVDMDTCLDAITQAHGHVVTFGLGLGYYAFMTAQKPDVTQVTVVEKNPDVIRLFSDVLLPQFPNKQKITVVQDDAFAFAEHTLPSLGADYVFVDTWRDASDGYPMYRRMKALEPLSGGCPFSYWIEGFILSRMRAFVFENVWESESAAPHGTEGDGSFEDILARLSRDGLIRHIQQGDTV